MPINSAKDNASGGSPHQNDPPRNAIAVDISADDQDLDFVALGLWCSVAGDVSVDMVGTGTAITIHIIPGWNKMRVSRIYNSGTTATGIVAGW